MFFFIDSELAGPEVVKHLLVFVSDGQLQAEALGLGVGGVVGGWGLFSLILGSRLTLPLLLFTIRL